MEIPYFFISFFWHLLIMLENIILFFLSISLSSLELGEITRTWNQNAICGVWDIVDIERCVTRVGRTVGSNTIIEIENNKTDPSFLFLFSVVISWWIVLLVTGLNVLSSIFISTSNKKIFSQRSPIKTSNS